MIDDYRNRIENAYQSFELHDAVTKITELVSLGNQHIHEKEPWRQSNEDASITMNNVSSIMQTASELYEPIIPDGAKKAQEAIRKGEKIILYSPYLRMHNRTSCAIMQRTALTSTL